MHAKAILAAALMILSASAAPGSARPVPVATGAEGVLPVAVPEGLAGKTGLLDSFGGLQSDLLFEKNVGQWGESALFRAHAGGYEAFVTATGMDLVQTRFGHNTAIGHERGPESPPPLPTESEQWTVTMTLVGGNPTPQVTTDAEDAFYTNYFIGNDSTQWHASVPHFRAVTLHGVYPGIDLAYHSAANGGLEYDFVVHPGADPAAIQQRFGGAASIQANDDGTLSLATGLGVIQQGVPRSWQADGIPVENRYDVSGDVVRFHLGERDPAQTLVIDPLVYSTYLGNGAGEDITVDPNGNAYITGCNGGTAFVSKLNAAGTSLLFSTSLGGNGYDCGNGIAIDPSGSVYITGESKSSDYPTTAGAYQVTGGDGSNFDAFVTKLNADGNTLVYSTYISSNDQNVGEAIAIDSSGNAYITGNTWATNYPTTTGAFQVTGGGYVDAFVTKLNPAGTGLVYSTRVGGSGSDLGEDIALDAGGNAFITGWVASFDYPTTIGAYQAAVGGSWDAFVTKVNAAGTGLVYSTYLGGSSDDTGEGIALDAAGNAYVVAKAHSTNYPTTSGAYRTTAGQVYDVAVTKLNAAGTGLLYSTYIPGNSDWDFGQAIAVDASGNAYITGETYSTNYPTTQGAYQPTSRGGGYSEAFITKVNSAGTTLAYSTFIGGSRHDAGGGIALDSAGNAYITGWTTSSDYPMTDGAYQTTPGGLFASKLELVAAVLPTAPSNLWDPLESTCRHASLSIL